MTILRHYTEEMKYSDRNTFTMNSIYRIHMDKVFHGLKTLNAKEIAFIKNTDAGVPVNPILDYARSPLFVEMRFFFPPLPIQDDWKGLLRVVRNYGGMLYRALQIAYGDGGRFKLGMMCYPRLSLIDDRWGGWCLYVVISRIRMRPEDRGYIYDKILDKGNYGNMPYAIYLLSHSIMDSQMKMEKKLDRALRHVIKDEMGIEINVRGEPIVALGLDGTVKGREEAGHIYVPDPTAGRFEVIQALKTVTRGQIELCRWRSDWNGCKMKSIGVQQFTTALKNLPRTSMRGKWKRFSFFHEQPYSSCLFAITCIACKDDGDKEVIDLKDKKHRGGFPKPMQRLYERHLEEIMDCSRIFKLLYDAEAGRLLPEEFARYDLWINRELEHREMMIAQLRDALAELKNQVTYHDENLKEYKEDAQYLADLDLVEYIHGNCTEIDDLCLEMGVEEKMAWKIVRKKRMKAIRKEISELRPPMHYSDPLGEANAIAVPVDFATAMWGE